MERHVTEVGLRLVRAIAASPRLRALLVSEGYTARDQRLAWQLVTRSGRGSPHHQLLVRAFLQAWAGTALRLVEREVRVRR
jgi:hypothetical protein